MNIETTHPSSFSARNLRVFFSFVLLGSILTLLTYHVGSRFGSYGVPVAIGLFLFAPIAIVIGVAGLNRGLRHLSDLKSSWTWWHTLLFLLFISTLVFRVRDVQAATSAPVDSWAMLRLVPEVIVAGVLIMRLASRRTPWLNDMFRGLVGALAVYSLVCTVSATWSVYASWTLYKALEFLLDVSVLAAILATVRHAGAFRLVFNCIWSLYALELVWTWIGAVIWPSDALDELGRLSGVWPVVASNSIGVSAAVISLIALARLFSRHEDKSQRPWYVLVFVFGFISLLASQTRNSMAGFLFGIFLVSWYERRTWISFLGTAISVPVLIFTSAGPLVWDFLARQQTESQIAGLSSRVGWWAFAWQQFMRHPMTGLGAYAGGKFAVLGRLGVGSASQMHSDWMEIIAGTSFWGLIPFTIALLGCWWILGRSFWDHSLTPTERQLSAEALGVLGIISLRSFFNVELCWHAPFLFLAVLGYAEFLRRKKKEQARALAGFNPTY